jgi:cell division transport system permease protein
MKNKASNAKQPNHRLTELGRIVKTGFVNFVRNPWLAIAAMAMMLVTLTITLFLIIANATFGNTIQQITDKIDISVYLKDSVTETQRNDFIDDIKQIPNVKSVSYLSKDDALEAYKQQNVNNTELLLAISQTDNPLPASIQIKPWDVNNIQSIKDFIEKPENKELQSDETSYSGDRKEAIDKITHATQFMRETAVVGVIIFTIISALIIFNTIQMAIFNRRDEIHIMRLLGANTNYIRGPFVVETMLYGVIAAVASIILVGSLFRLASSTFEASSLGLLDIDYASRYFSKNFWIILTGQTIIGILIGAVSSIIATKRYLKFKSVK